MDTIGVMNMPEDFKYRQVYLKGRPRHDRFDSFSIRHPQMDCRKRAKLFAPFDALRGFNFAIMSKEVTYEEKPELSREDERELNRRLILLRELTLNPRMARNNNVFVAATVFRLCTDVHNEAYGIKGQCTELSGICRSLDPENQTIQIGDAIIPFKNILKIESPGISFSKHRRETPAFCW